MAVIDSTHETAKNNPNTLAFSNSHATAVNGNKTVRRNC